MAKSSFWGVLPETDWHDWPEQYPSTYPGDTGIECLWRTLPRCIPPSEGCPRIMASTRLLHTERRFGITLAAAGSEWTNRKSRYQQEATRYQRNHQLPTSLSQPHNYEGWHWNHENVKNDCNKKLKTIILLLNTASDMSWWHNQYLLPAYSYYTPDILGCPRVTYAAVSVRTTPMASRSPRIEKQALMLVSLLVSLLVCHVRNQRHRPWRQLYDPRNSKRDQQSWAIQA